MAIRTRSHVIVRLRVEADYRAERVTLAEARVAGERAEARAAQSGISRPPGYPREAGRVGGRNKRDEQSESSGPF